jgi:hypothetical protein
MAPLRTRAYAHVRSAEKLDPVENVDGLPVAEEENLEFPFNISSEDKKRIAQESVADNS